MSKKTYKEKVREQFSKTINKYIRYGHWGNLTKETIELTDKYFDESFETGKLPQDLVSEFVGEKFRSKECDYARNEAEVEVIAKFLTKTLTGLIQNTAKEIKENIQNLTDDQIQAHKEDIASFAELETMCSTDCDCEESCAADIHYIVNTESDGRMKAYLETNKNEIAKLIKYCNEYKIDTDTALNFIQMLSCTPDAKACLDKICKFEYKYEIESYKDANISLRNTIFDFLNTIEQSGHKNDEGMDKATKALLNLAAILKDDKLIDMSNRKELKLDRIILRDLLTDRINKTIES